MSQLDPLLQELSVWEKYTGDAALANLLRRSRLALEASAGSARQELKWQYCYVEYYTDGSGIHERVTFYDEAKAWKYLEDNADDVEAWNREDAHETREEDEWDYHITAAVQRRRVMEPGEWETVDKPSEGV